MVWLCSVIFPLKAIAGRAVPCKVEREDAEKTTRITMVIGNFEIGSAWRRAKIDAPVILKSPDRKEILRKRPKHWQTNLSLELDSSLNPYPCLRVTELFYYFFYSFIIFIILLLLICNLSLIIYYAIAIERSHCRQDIQNDFVPLNAQDEFYSSRCKIENASCDFKEMRMQCFLPRSFRISIAEATRCSLTFRRCSIVTSSRRARYIKLEHSLVNRENIPTTAASS